MKRVHVTMPRWPAYLMGAFAIACAYPAITAPAPAERQVSGPHSTPNQAIAAAELNLAAQMAGDSG